MKKTRDNDFPGKTPEFRGFPDLSYLFSLLDSSDQLHTFEQLYDFHAMKCYMKFTIRALNFLGLGSVSIVVLLH